MNTGKFLSIILCLLSSILGDENEQSRDVYRKMIARRREENLARILNFLPLPEYPYENSVKKFLPTKEKIEEYKKNKKIHEKLEKANLVDPIKLEL
ncbi:CLUMA_CG002580, isoform A [Clunio marinus]|uniref:CLUMA_CG002580, isoform A n=1 Tax=Clunio marinus TaxID=568069 RepID=A0A1J1HRF9_9DIPT|nr:CLUMA_CG002580, isoform A [Clunio marinus]